MPDRAILPNTNSVFRFAPNFSYDFVLGNDRRMSGGYTYNDAGRQAGLFPGLNEGLPLDAGLLAWSTR